MKTANFEQKSMKMGVRQEKYIVRGKRFYCSERAGINSIQLLAANNKN